MDRREAITTIAAVAVTGGALTGLTPSPDASEFDRALADYRAKQAFSDSLPLGTPNEDDAVEAHCAAMDHLIEDVPAQNLNQVITKMELGMQRGDGFNDSLLSCHLEAIFADLQRLAGRA